MPPQRPARGTTRRLRLQFLDLNRVARGKVPLALSIDGGVS